MRERNIDLFAGAGGIDIGARIVGIDHLGIETDRDTIATREAAGLRTLTADVSALDPHDFDGGGNLAAAPPCPTWSRSGLHAGKTDGELVFEALGGLANGVDRRADLRARCIDERSMLVAEPLRWALILKPSTCLFEQVPSVLPYWQYTADVLRLYGYTAWCGVVNAADYGVPQTRKRAVLLASLGRGFYPPNDEADVIHRGMSDVLPWHPEALVGFPRRADRNPRNGELRPFVEINGVRYRSRDFRKGTEPSFTITEKARSWSRYEPGETEPRRVTLEEATALQTFPVHPWQGTRTSQFLQLANTVPPTLAAYLYRKVTR